MAVKFVVDSASDILPQEALDMGITRISMKVSFGTEEYADGIELDHTQFYEKLAQADELPRTSQITPIEFSDTYESVLGDGDELVVITMSGKLSGTYQSAMLAAQDYEGKVFVVDSDNATLGERIIVERGLELAKQGMRAKDIAATLDVEKKKVRLIALLDTLEYLKKGGRISSTVAFVGSMLSIKPVVAVEDGEVKQVGRARGSKQGNNLLRELIGKCGGVNFDMPYALAYSGTSDSLLVKYIDENKDLYDERIVAEKLPIHTVGSTIGTHVGPGAIAVAFFEN
ncbi:MAG: DegV family protein [Lachnospiraceae bacterium]|nr:DegV family protein [Lachnospiraceae bacterium]